MLQGRRYSPKRHRRKNVFPSNRVYLLRTPGEDDSDFDSPKLCRDVAFLSRRLSVSFSPSVASLLLPPRRLRLPRAQSTRRRSALGKRCLAALPFPLFFISQGFANESHQVWPLHLNWATGCCMSVLQPAPDSLSHSGICFAWLFP
ncbi:hypothetical protein DPEC_G00102850 [Dallia pectoralis]|uniref:Uncharacterized protein n=1 Tax=Dallia pectoralis TaxID=75939 RepID=A0ACC2GXL9_DALPE|nr:hypothetical protein DPEC_G00102850 [Dallia pectoralis]